MLITYEVVVNESSDDSFSRGSPNMPAYPFLSLESLPTFPEGHRGNSEFNQPLPSESLGVN